jgi:hypothetical protein
MAKGFSWSPKNPVYIRAYVKPLVLVVSMMHAAAI